MFLDILCNSKLNIIISFLKTDKIPKTISLKMKVSYLTILLEEWSKGVATLGAVKLDHEQLGHNS